MAKSIIPYLGNKSLLADELLGRIRLYSNQYGLKRYIEPCGGSGVVIMQVEGMERVYNDIGRGLVDLMRCVQDKELLERLIALLKSIPYTRTNFKYAVKHWDAEGVPELERAAYTYIAAHQSIVGGMKSFYISYQEDENEEMIANYYDSIENLWEFHWSFQGMATRRDDLQVVIRDFRMDSEALILLDPPYVVPKGRFAIKKHYKNHFTLEDHAKMVDLLVDAKCKVMINGYNDMIKGHDKPLYGKLIENGWQKRELDIIPVRSATFGGGEMREAVEHLWTNFEQNIWSGV